MSGSYPATILAPASCFVAIILTRKILIFNFLSLSAIFFAAASSCSFFLSSFLSSLTSPSGESTSFTSNNSPPICLTASLNSGLILILFFTFFSLISGWSSTSTASASLVTSRRSFLQLENASLYAFTFFFLKGDCCLVFCPHSDSSCCQRLTSSSCSFLLISEIVSK